jgi:hypothetical protein
MNDNTDEIYVNDLTERVFLIKSELESGKLKIASHLMAGFIQSFKKVRLRDDGKVDPSTVDGRIRAMGAAVNHFFERNMIKRKYKIIDLEKAYFNILFENFGDPYFDMLKNGNEPYEMAYFLSEQEDYANHIYDKFNELFILAKDFWSTMSEIGVVHLQDGEQLKANFSGDLFPSYSENMVSLAGLYVDTLVLPCPLLRVGRLHEHVSKKEFCNLLIKHVLTCMTYRDVALEEIDPPIALVLPDNRDYVEEDQKNLIDVSMPHILTHASYLYGRKFTHKDEFEEFSMHLTDIEMVFRELKRPERLIFDTEWGGDARSQLTRQMADSSRITAKLFDNNPGMEVFFNCMGRIPQAYAAKSTAQNLGSTPYINAETSWLYYTWMIEYESQGFNTKDSDLRNLHMVHAVTSGMQDGFSWLGKIPLDNLIKIRRQGLMPEVREVLSKGVGSLINSTPANFQLTSQTVIDNVDRAFIEHQRFLEKARRDKLEILGVKVAPWVINGVIGIAAVLMNNPSLAVASVGLSSYGLPTFKDIKSAFKERDEKIASYRNSATGILFSTIK